MPTCSLYAAKDVRWEPKALISKANKPILIAFFVMLAFVLLDFAVHVITSGDDADPARFVRVGLLIFMAVVATEAFRTSIDYVRRMHIRRAADAITRSFGTESTCYRTGGDEFTALLLGVSLDERARRCREPLRSFVAERGPSDKDLPPLSIACGSACVEMRRAKRVRRARTRRHTHVRRQARHEKRCLGIHRA